jgi:hypothetical protein
MMRELHDQAGIRFDLGASTGAGAASPSIEFAIALD